MKRIGKSLRNADDGSIAALREYRKWRSDDLLAAGELVQTVLPGDVDLNLSGRLKRTYAIRRKLLRTATMDLSRMADVVGLRLLVDREEDVDAVLGAILDLVEVMGHKDNVAVPQESGYRAHHIFLRLPTKEDGTALRTVELQVRTMRQHFWASLSESFGEATKEGRGSAELRTWLRAVSDTLHEPELRALDLGLAASAAGATEPLELTVLAYDLHNASVEGFLKLGSALDIALEMQTLYEQRNVGAERFESVLLMNAGGDSGNLSHMRYFLPQGRPALPQELLDLIGPAPVPDAEVWIPET